MTTTLLQLRNKVYEILTRSSTTYGMLTPTKIDEAINDAFDLISAKMFKIGGGWLHKRSYISVVSGTAGYSIPSGVAVINYIKMKQSVTDDYVPLDYNENWSGATVDPATAASGVYLPVWSFVNAKINLEPPPTTSVANGLLVDAIYFPDVLTLDVDEVTGDMDNRIFIQYAKWRAASIAWSYTTQGDAPWMQFELEWKQACQEMLSRRFRQPTPMLSFDG